MLDESARSIQRVAIDRVPVQTQRMMDRRHQVVGMHRLLLRISAIAIRRSVDQAAADVRCALAWLRSSPSAIRNSAAPVRTIIFARGERLANDSCFDLGGLLR